MQDIIIGSCIISLTIYVGVVVLRACRKDKKIDTAIHESLYKIV